MVYVAIGVSVVTLLVMLLLAAQRRLGRGLLAFFLIMSFTVSAGFIIGELSSPAGSSGWVLAIGALLVGPVVFIRYYNRGGDRGPS